MSDTSKITVGEFIDLLNEWKSIRPSVEVKPDTHFSGSVRITQQLDENGHVIDPPTADEIKKIKKVIEVLVKNNNVLTQKVKAIDDSSKRL